MHLPKDLKSTIASLTLITASLLLVAVIALSVPATRTAILGTISSAAAGMISPDDTSIITQNALKKMDPEAVAEIINDDESRGALIDLIEDTLPNIEPGALAEGINEALEEETTSDFVSQVMPFVEPEAMSDLANTLMSHPAAVDLVTETAASLDTQGISDLVGDLATVKDDQGRLVLGNLGGSILGFLDPVAISDMVNEVMDDPAVSDFMGDLISQIVEDMDMADIADGEIYGLVLSDLVNQVLPDLAPGAVANLLNGIMTSDDMVDLVEGLIPELDPAALARLINNIEGMGPFLSGLVPNLDVAGMADVVNGLLAAEGVAPWMNGLIGELDAEKVADLVNDLEGLGDFVNELLPSLDAPAMAGVVNGIVANPNMPGWMDSLVDELDTDKVAMLVNNLDSLGYFLNDLIPNLDAAGMADVVNGLLADPNMPDWVDDLVGELDANKVATLINDLDGLGDFLNDLVPNLDAAGMADVVNGILGAPGMPVWMTDLVCGLQADRIADLVNGLMESEGLATWVNSFIEGLDGNSLADLVNSLGEVGDFFCDLVNELDGAAIGGLVNQLVAVGGLESFLTDLMDELEGDTLIKLFASRPRVLDWTMTYYYRNYVDNGPAGDVTGTGVPPSEAVTSWEHVRSVAISNSNTGALSDYQVKLIVDTETLIDDGHMEPDCRDIRFTASYDEVPEDGNCLPYWINPDTIDTTATEIWVRVPSIPTGGSSIYMYYGNPGADPNDGSNGEATFNFFDDFLGDLSKWDGDTSEGSVAGGILTYNIGDTAKRIYTDTTYGQGYATIGRLQWPDSTADTISSDFGFHTIGVDFQRAHFVDCTIFGLTNCLITRTDDDPLQQECLSNQSQWVADSYATWEVRRNGSTNVEFYIDGVECSGSPMDTWVPDQAMPVKMAVRNKTVYVDWVLVRKTASSEPRATVATGWFSDWQLREPVYVSNGSGESLSDYQVKLTVDTPAVIAAGALDDGGDLRFTASDGQIGLPYWIQTWNPSGDSTVWVRVPKIPTGGMSIYAYYGKSGAVSESSVSDTFPGQYSDWDYVRPIEITETSGEALNNYQVLVSFDTSNFDFSKLDPEGDDIRFYSLEDGQECDYWIETWDASGQALTTDVVMDDMTADVVIADLTADAGIGDTSVEVADASIFPVGSEVRIYETGWLDDYVGEFHTVVSNVGTTVGLDGSLAKEYLLADLAKVGLTDIEVSDSSQFPIGSVVRVYETGGDKVGQWALVDSYPTATTVRLDRGLTSGYQVADGAVLGSNEFQVSDASQFPIGTVVRIYESADDTVGETGTVTYSSGTAVRVYSGLNKSYQVADGARLVLISRIWFEVPNLPADETTTVLMYYGNSDAQAESNGSDTFVFFDDFETGVLSNWDSSPGDWDVTTSGTFEGDYSAYSLGGGWTSLETSSSELASMTRGVVEFRVKLANATSHYNVINIDGFSGSGTMETGHGTGGTYCRFGWKYGGSWKDLPVRTSVVAGRWHDIKAFIDLDHTVGGLSDGRAGIYIDGLWKGWMDKFHSPLELAEDLDPLGLSCLDSDAGAISLDVYRVRKYATSQPTVSIGEEGVPETFTTFTDSFNNQTKVSSFTNMSVAAGRAILDTGEDWGRVVSVPIPMDTDRRMAVGHQLSWNDTEDGDADVKYWLEYSNDGTTWVLVPDTAVAGNSAGFDESPINIGPIDGVQTGITPDYEQIRLRAELTAALRLSDATIQLVNDIIDEITADGALSDLLLALDPYLRDSVYTDVWVHCLIPHFTLDFYGLIVDLEGIDLWAKLSQAGGYSIYFGPDSEQLIQDIIDSYTG